MRRLVSANGPIKGAIKGFMDDKLGGKKIAMLGFDACLMMSYAAAAKYQDVAEYAGFNKLVFTHYQ